MPTTRRPRRGSLQYWPRVRAKKQVVRTRCWKKTDTPKLLGFAGYKAGMTHIIVNDTRESSMTKGENISLPVTVIECPPISVLAVRFYEMHDSGLRLETEVFPNFDKDLEKVLPKRKNPEKSLTRLNEIEEHLDNFADIRLLVSTQPKLTGIGKKRPDLMEIGVGGSLREKFEYARSILGKDISVKDVLQEGALVDVKAVTTGKGFQGTTKRFGTAVRTRKTEKAKRGPGTLGPWHPAKVRYYTPQAGKMGYHSRTEYNKRIIKIGDNSEEVNVRGGFLRYGLIKKDYLLLKGSIPGCAKRLVRLNLAVRPNRKVDEQPFQIQEINLESKQGV